MMNGVHFIFYLYQMLHIGNIKINRKCELKIICHSTPPSAAMAEVLWGTLLKIRVDLPYWNSKLVLGGCMYLKWIDGTLSS
jgi:hypothetical protein